MVTPLAVCLLITALSACSSDKPRTAPTDAELVDRLMANSSDRLAGAWEMLARTEAGGASLPLASPIDVAALPDPLRSPVTWSWTGPAEQAVKALADRIHYKFLSEGIRVTSPLIVTVNANATPMVLVFQDIGLQLGSRARLVVDPNSATLIFRREPMEGPS
jgi:hypothetical protein